LASGGVARSLQIHADMRLARAWPAAKIPASSCHLNLLPTPFQWKHHFFKPGNTFTQLARNSVVTTETWPHPVIVGNRIFVKDVDTPGLWTIEQIPMFS